MFLWKVEEKHQQKIIQKILFCLLPQSRFSQNPSQVNKIPQKTMIQFFNDFRQVKIMVKFLGYISKAVFEILSFKKPILTKNSRQDLVFGAIFWKLIGKPTLKIIQWLFHIFRLLTIAISHLEEFLGMRFVWTYCALFTTKMVCMCVRHASAIHRVVNNISSYMNLVLQLGHNHKAGIS